MARVLVTAQWPVPTEGLSQAGRAPRVGESECVCVRARVRMYEWTRRHACMRACMRVCVCMYLCMSLYVSKHVRRNKRM